MSTSTPVHAEGGPPIVSSAKAPYSSADYGLALLRIMLATVFVYHGLPKLMDLTATAGAMEKMGVPLPWFGALAAGLCEAGGGLLILVGLFTRWVSIPVAFTMLVACSVHWPVFDARHGGFEYPLTLAVATAALGLIGPGRLSHDACRSGDCGGPTSPRV